MCAKPLPSLPSFLPRGGVQELRVSVGQRGDTLHIARACALFLSVSPLSLSVSMCVCVLFSTAHRLTLSGVHAHSECPFPQAEKLRSTLSSSIPPILLSPRGKGEGEGNTHINTERERGSVCPFPILLTHVAGLSFAHPLPPSPDHTPIYPFLTTTTTFEV